MRNYGLVCVVLIGLINGIDVASEVTNSTDAPISASGNGDIYAIPSLYPPSVKNGQQLSLHVVVKACAGVKSVVADLGGVETIALSPDSVTRDADNHAIAGLWTAKWIGHDLQEKMYDVTLRIADLDGHVFEDTSLHFSDPIAGLSTPGIAASAPYTAVREVRSDAIFNTQDNVPFCAVYDAAQGIALFGTFSVPGQIIKVSLNGPSGVPVRVGVLTLNAGENNLHSAVYDPATGTALFGCDSSIPTPGIVVKIGIGDPGQPPRRIGAVMLNTGETSPESAVWDPLNQVALFGCFATPSAIVKVAMNAPADPPTRQGAITAAGLEAQVHSAIIDPVNSVALFGTDNINPGAIVKVAVNGPTGPPVHIGFLILQTDETCFQTGIFDAANNVALFAMHPNPSYPAATPKVVKVALNNPGDLPTRVSVLTLNAGEDIKVIAPGLVSGTFLMSTDVTPAAIIKIATGAAVDTPTRIGTSLTLNAGEDRCSTAVVDASQNVALFAGGASAGGIIPYVTKISFGATAADVPTRVNSLALNIAELSAFCAVYDPTNKVALFGMNGSAPRIVKVGLGAANGVPTRLGVVPLTTAEGSLGSCVIDAANSVALFSTSSSPAVVIKVALNAPAAPPTRVGSVTLNSGENNCQTGVLDTVNGIALFATSTSPSIIVKVALNAPAAAPTRVSSLTLNTGENNMASVAGDPANGVALFGATSSNPSPIVKVAFDLPVNPPTRVGATASLVSGENGFFAGCIDLTHNVGLFSTNTSPMKIVKVALNLPGDLPTRVGTLVLASGENSSNGAVFDQTNGLALFTTFTSPARVVVVSPGLATDIPTRVSGTTLNANENSNSAIVVDPALAEAFTANSSVSKLETLTYSAKGAVAATRMTLSEYADVTELRFFSHSAAGNLRFAIYDSSTDKKLLWQSSSVANTAAKAELAVPISTGTPSTLRLAPGSYYLAWQSDVIANVASYTPGGFGDGFLAAQTYGPYFATIPLSSQTFNSDRYTEYIAYTVPPPLSLAASADPTVAGVNQTVQFSAVGTSLNQAVTLTYAWVFSDGGNATGANPTHKFAAPGAFTATVTLSDGIGDTLIKTINLTVDAPTLTVSADPSGAFTGVPVSFDASAFFYTGANVTYAWNFGDGGSGTGAAPSHVYAALGDYTVNVTATDSIGGATVSGSVMVHVKTIPVTVSSGPTPSSNPAGVGQNVTFTTSASGTPGLTLSYAWSFGDGASGTGATVSNIYTAPGTYTVSVTVTDGVGGTVTQSVDLKVLGPVIGSGSNDSDGDGFSDGFETANSTSPTDAASTPFDNTSAITFSALTVIKPSIALNFAKPNSDSIKFSGTLDVPAGFAGSGKHFYVVVGDLLKKFTLDGKNSAKTADGSVKLSIKASKGVVAQQTGKYSVALSKGSFAVQLAPSGLTGDADITTPASRSVPFAIFFNNKTFQKTQTMLYTAKKGKSGKAK